MKEQILTVALKLAEKKGYDKITRDELADKVGCATGLINHHYGTMNQLRRDIMRHAIKERILTVVAQGLAARDPFALKANDDLKKEALQTLM